MCNVHTIVWTIYAVFCRFGPFYHTFRIGVINQKQKRRNPEAYNMYSLKVYVGRVVNMNYKASDFTREDQIPRDEYNI